ILGLVGLPGNANHFRIHASAHKRLDFNHTSARPSIPLLTNGKVAPPEDDQRLFLGDRDAQRRIRQVEIDDFSRGHLESGEFYESKRSIRKDESSFFRRRANRPSVSMREGTGCNSLNGRPTGGMAGCPKAVSNWPLPPNNIESRRRSFLRVL